MGHHDILSWANGHLERVEASIAEFMGKYPYNIRPDDENYRPETDELRMIISIGPFDPPSDWVFKIGDTLHNMRIALDYLAFRIARNNGCIADESQITFPIFDDPQAFRSTTGRTLKGLPRHILDAIEQFQPYPARGRERAQLLAQLSRLENIHKHRHPLAAFPGIDYLMFRVHDDPDNVVKVESFALKGPLVNGAVVARYRFNGNRKAHVESRVGFHIFFDDTVSGTAPMAVIRTLKHIRDFVGQVVFKELDQFA